MSKGQTNIQGIYKMWRSYPTWSALRVAIRAPNERQQITISGKLYPLLKSINDYLEANKLHQEQAEESAEFKQLFDRLCQELKKDYALPYYKILEKLDLEKKSFNFKDSLDDFETYKTRHSISHAYRIYVERFWLPFFLNKKLCQHPRDFVEHHAAAEFYLRSTKNKHGRLYSPAAYNSMTTPLNEYMRFLLKTRVIEQSQFFTVDHKLTLEERKRRLHTPVRTTDTYTVKDLESIKEKIDARYFDPEDLKWKLRAYAIYLGSFCMGLRVGNILGTPTKNLRPDAEVPYLQLKDNIVNGWSRGLKGDLLIEDATKTSCDDNVKLPFLLPTKEICIEVANFLKKHIKPNDKILKCSSGVPSRWWRQISEDCGFRYLHPHAGKHSFATIGAANMHLFNDNPYLLQQCCLHSDYRTTLKYINKKSDELLKQFLK